MWQAEGGTGTGNTAAEEGVGGMAGGRWRPAGGVACHALATEALENSSWPAVNGPMKIWRPRKNRRKIGATWPRGQSLNPCFIYSLDANWKYMFDVLHYSCLVAALSKYMFGSRLYWNFKSTLLTLGWFIDSISLFRILCQKSDAVSSHFCIL